MVSATTAGVGFGYPPQVPDNFLVRWWTYPRRRRIERWQNSHPVVESLLGEGADAAPARRVAAVAPKETAALADIMARAQAVLAPSGQAYIRALINDAVTAADSAVSARGHLTEEERDALVAQTARATAYLDRRIGELTRRRYARGLVTGVGWSVLILGAVGVMAMVIIRTFLWISNDGSWLEVVIPEEQIRAVRDMLVAIGGGAAGATVSVLMRLHRATDLTPEAVDDGAARYRIILGWFFAAAVLAFIKGGLLAGGLSDPTVVADSLVVGSDPGQVTAAEAQAAVIGSWFFWASVGFLAGFNERFATKIITRDEEDGVVVAAPRSAKPE